MKKQITRHNNTIRPLTSSNSFRGNGENTDDYQGVFINCFADQNCSLLLEWSNDGVHYYFSTTENIIESVPFTKSFQNLGQYFKLRVTNDSGNDMTVLSCSSYFIHDVPDGNVSIEQPFVRSQLWNNESVSNSTTSSSVDITTVKQIDIFGTVSGGCDLLVQVSDDDAIFFDSSFTISCVGNDFHATIGLSAKYMRLWVTSGGSRTITAFVHGK